MSRYDRVRAELTANPRRWVVTGAAGFIGSALVETLLQLDQEVVGLDNFITGHQRNLDDVAAIVGAERAGRLTFIEGDICDLDTCNKACEGADVVLHQAAIGSVPRSIDDPLGSHRANVDGFLNTALAARDAGVKRFVYASSSAVYGDEPVLPKVENRIGRPLSPYAVTKYINELYARIVQDCYDLGTVGLRYFNVFGRRQDPDGPYAAVIPRWIDLLLNDKPCLIFGDGTQSRDFCYVDNAVQANILAGLAPDDATNQIYNVGVGGRTTLTELFTALRDGVAGHYDGAAGADPVFEAPRPGDIPHSQADVGKLERALGYEPTHDIRSGLVETVDWFVKNQNS